MSPYFQSSQHYNLFSPPRYRQLEKRYQVVVVSQVTCTQIWPPSMRELDVLKAEMVPLHRSLFLLCPMMVSEMCLSGDMYTLLILLSVTQKDNSVNLPLFSPIECSPNMHYFPLFLYLSSRLFAWTFLKSLISLKNSIVITTIYMYKHKSTHFTANRNTMYLSKREQPHSNSD